MGVTADTLKHATVHAIGILVLWYLSRDLYDHGPVEALLCTGNATCRWLVIELIPAGVLRFDIGFLLKGLVVLLASAYLFYAAAWLYRRVFAPLDEVHHYKARDMGYQIPPGKNRKEVGNLVQKLRKVGDIPPPYPNGWYEVMRSNDLPRKTVKAVTMIGENLAVFRGEDGKVCVIDAYCPHLGANLGVGGRVHGNCIECPFHGWQFDGESGQCVSIPYAEKIPVFAKTKVWPSAELYGLIFVWYDAEGRDPMYLLEDIEEIRTRRWTYRGRIIHYIAAHIEEISENGADVAHLGALHEPNVTVGANLDFAESWLSRLLTHKWTASWKAKSDTERHIGHMSLHLANCIFGIRIPFLDAFIETDQVGPSVVYLRLKTILGSGVWIQTVVPEEPLHQRMTNHLFFDSWMLSLIPTTIMRGMGIQIDRDVNVWTNKTYLSKPLLVREDRLIAEHRRWYSQFYSEHSIKFSLNNSKNVSW